MGLEIRRAPFEGKVVHPIIYRCFKKHLRWLFGISEPSTVSLAYLYKLPMFFVAARNDQILYSRPTHLKTTICYPFTATSGWVDSSSNIGPSIYYHTPSITQYSFFPSYQSFLPKKSKFSNQPCPPNHHVPQLHPTQPNQPCHSPPPTPTCWSKRRSRDSHAKHNDSRSPGHFDKPPGGGWSKAKAPEGRGANPQLRVSDLDRTPQVFGFETGGEQSLMVGFVFLMEKIPYLQICLEKVFVGSCFIVRKVCLYKLIMQYMFFVLHYNTLY